MSSQNVEQDKNSCQLSSLCHLNATLPFFCVPGSQKTAGCSWILVFEMKITDSNVIRFHLQALYGIHVKNFAKKKGKLVYTGAKVFGVPLENLPRRYIPEFGLVPCFLVDGCSFLLDRIATVGLFRKPGSLPRVKILREKLNRGDDALSTASPYDIATLVKQFCRELPELLFPSEVHAALLKAQAIPDLQAKMAALQLLSCLLPARNSSCLQYLFDFLHKVSQRCSDNLMTSSNLATVFVPCLLPPPNKTEMSQERLELRVLVLRTFIEFPHVFGVIPKSVMDSMKYFIHLEDVYKKRNQKMRSLTVKRSEKIMLWIQSKPKLRLTVSEPTLICVTRGDPKLRRSIGLETFPNIQLFRTSMPNKDQSCRSSNKTFVTALERLQHKNWRRRSSPI